MHIEFGWSADGAAWADAQAMRGRVRMGPRALTGLLQSRLGLTRPVVEPVVRTAQYMLLIRRRLAALEDPQAFWPLRSFTADPWATTRELLRRRDAAVEAGWRASDPGQPLPDRLATLRDLEQSVVVGMPGTADEHDRTATLGPGTADDLVELVDLLAQLQAAGESWPLGIDRIALSERPAALPGLWPRLLSLLEQAGVALQLPSEEAGAPPRLDVVRCLDEWSAADVAARHLAASPVAGDEPLTLLASSDTHVLDRALRRRGLPAVGAVGASTDRAHHQVLGLFLDVATAPVDVHQLAALLDLRLLPGTAEDAEPVGLVPAMARRELLTALTREPGVGGPAWRTALERLEHRPDAHRALEAARVIDRMVSDPLPADGLRPQEIATRLTWLAERLRAVTHADGELLSSLGQVRTLQEVLRMLDEGTRLSRRTLQQIIDGCGGAGSSPLACREVSPWSVTTRPSQVRAAGGTVVWWGPGPDEASPAVLWDHEETQCLRAAGAHLLEPEQLAALHVTADLRGLRSAGRVVAVLPGRRHEQAPPPSGLLAHLEADLGRGEEEHLAPESLIRDGVWHLADRRLPLRVPPAEQPRPPREPVETIDPAPQLMPARLSFTQAQTLIACPRQWMLEYALGIRPAPVAALPTGSRMIGTLVHAVVEALVRERWDPALEGPPLAAPTPAEIGAMFDRLVPQFASELDLPGRATERNDARERTVRSLGELFEGLSRADLRITGTESRFEVPLALPLADGDRTVAFVGSRDVDALDGAGRPTVIDLKWSRSRSRYADLFDTGEAIQLAAYAWSLGRAGPSAPLADVGYFLLRSGEFVAANPALDPRQRSPMDVQAAWDRMVAAIVTALDEIRAGRITAGCRALLARTGLPPDAAYSTRRKAVEQARAAARETGGIVIESYCASSDHAQLCGLTGEPG